MPVNNELYATLEVSVTASVDEIKKAFRRLALIHHPDKGGDEEQFKRIKMAYEILKDVEKRDIYDRFGLDGLKHGPQSNIFDNLFDGGIGNIFNMFTNVRRAMTKSKPIFYDREVTLEELCTRKVIAIKVTRDNVCICCNTNKQVCKSCGGRGMFQNVIGGIFVTKSVCTDCNGHGTNISYCGECKNGIVDDCKLFNIYLTPEMHNGYHYKFPGEGNQYPGVLQGDFIVNIKYKKHPQFSVDNGNLIYKRRTSLREALCGYESLVLHPNGESVKISFSGIIPPDGKKTIAGKGMDVGYDLVVIHDVYFPEKLSEKQIQKINKILS